MFTLALVLILTAVAYFLVMTLADLHPFNNVRDARRADRITEVAVNAPILTLPAVVLVMGAILSMPALGYAAAGVEVLATIGGLTVWWMPYLTGVSAPWAAAGTGMTWPELHARTYARTVIVLPRIGDRPRPNLEHMILHALFGAAAICAALAAPAL